MVTQKNSFIFQNATFCNTNTIEKNTFGRSTRNLQDVLRTIILQQQERYNEVFSAVICVQLRLNLAKK